MDEISIERARPVLGEIVDRARLAEQPTLLTRQSKPAAVVVSHAWYEQDAAIRSEVSKIRQGAHVLGRVVTGQARAMEAARIEMLQGSTEKAMEWILQSLPDVDDNEPEDQWNGTETAQEWFDRTREKR